MKKNIIISTSIALISFVMNFAVFTISYNKLATPYLHEEQKVENADFIMSSTLIMFVISAIIVGVLIYIIGRKKA